MTAYALDGGSTRRPRCSCRPPDEIEALLSDGGATIRQIAERIYRQRAPVRDRPRPELSDGARSRAEDQRGQLHPRRGLRGRRAEAWRHRADRAGHAVLVLAPRRDLRRHPVGREEIKARGGDIIGISPEPRRGWDVTSRLRTSGEARRIVKAVPAQCSATTWPCCAARIPTSRATWPRASPSSSRRAPAVLDGRLNWKRRRWRRARCGARPCRC